jgi:hypothetical protein
MNCIRCNMPLEANARFCRNCGFPVSNPASTPDANANANGDPGRANPSPLYQPISSNTDAPTIPPTSWQAPSNMPRQQQVYLSGQSEQPAQAAPTLRAQPWQQRQDQQQAWMPASSPPAPVFQPNKQNEVGTMRSGAAKQPGRRRGGVRRLIGPVIALVLVVALLIVGRFALNAFAINQINQALSGAIDNIPAPVAVLPERDQTITDSMVNNLITYQSSAASPVQNLTIHFTKNDVQINFNVFAFSSTITTVPKIVNGKLVATNVTVQGIAGLILSPDDITNLMNTQIRNMETHIRHTITAVTLQDGAIVLHIKPSSSTPTTPPTIPTGVPTTIPTGIPTLPSIP